MKKSIYTSEQEALQALLRQVRKESGLSQGQLAKKLGTLQTVVSNWEIGERRLDVLELRQICAALEIPFSEFMARLEGMLQPKQEKTDMGKQNRVRETPVNYVSRDPEGDRDRFLSVIEQLVPPVEESNAQMPNERRSDEMPEPLLEERQFFVEMLPQWLPEHEGQYALVKGRELIGFYDDIGDALETTADRFGEDDSLIRRVQAEPDRYQQGERILLVGGNLTGRVSRTEPGTTP